MVLNTEIYQAIKSIPTLMSEVSEDIKKGMANTLEVAEETNVGKLIDSAKTGDEEFKKIAKSFESLGEICEVIIKEYEAADAALN